MHQFGRHQIAQRRIDQPLPPDPRHPRKRRRRHHQREMALPRSAMPGMAAVALAVVDDLQRLGAECGTQPRLDFVGHPTHIHPSELLPPSIVNAGQSPRSLPIATESPEAPRRPQRLHGRIERDDACDHPGCASPGEFRAPRSNRVPGSEAGWQFLCLDHVRAFNAGYNFFDGLSADEIRDAQSPLAGWERAASPKGREAFSFGDAHDLFNTQSRPPPRPRKWSAFGDAQALQALGLTDAATATDIRRAYKRLVRRYHPDSNEGDRSMEGKLQAVVNAYTHLKGASAFNPES